MTHQEFASAYTSYFGLTRRFLLSRGVAPFRAEELAQAAWSKAWERREQLRELASITAWVNTIALNLLRGEIRHSAPQVAIDDRDEPVRLAVDQHIDAEKVLGSLSDEDRRLMLLHVVAGLTSKEIATTSKLSPVAIRVRLHRAKMELLEKFTGRDGRPPRRTCHRRRGPGRRAGHLS
jgi:RNA polymerase sigma-70 factor (ECF subfamily)